MTVRTFFVGVVGMGALLWGGLSAAPAQEATEIYIPIGQSPGLSGKYTLIGKIDTINAQDRTIAIAGPTGTWSVAITEGTRIWLDRSKLRLTNLRGTFADLRRGLTVEVKQENHRRRTPSGPAEWIKVQLPAAS